MLIDSHCHLDLLRSRHHCNLDPVIAAAKAAGVQSIIVPSLGPDNWDEVMTLAQQYQQVSVALGIHPYRVSAYQPNWLQQQVRCIEQALRLCAIGEVGLDKASGPMALQLQVLETQLHLAQQYDLPIILHNRRCHGEWFALLRHYPGVRGVLHAFSGSEALAWDYINRGFKLGIGGVITYERAHKTRKTLERLPLDALLLETDAPDMPVQGQAGQINQPAKLAQVFAALVAIRAEPAQLLAQQLTANTRALLGQVRSP